MCLLPCHIFYRQARIEIAKTLWNILISPFGKVRFRHFFMADVLTSMTHSLQDTAIIACYLKTGDFRTSKNVDDLAAVCPALYDYKIIWGFLPYWFRFGQCLHRYKESGLKANLVNAGKYFSDLLVPLVGLPIFLKSNSSLDPLMNDEVNTAFWVYIAIKTISATYSYAWDIYMDWGLLRQNAKGHPNRFLRDKINYNPYFYYWSMFSDLLLRFWWIVPLFSVTKGSKESAFN